MERNVQNGSRALLNSRRDRNFVKRTDVRANQNGFRSNRSPLSRLLLPAALLPLALAAALALRPAEPEGRAGTGPHFPAPAAFQAAMEERNAVFLAELGQVAAAHPTDHVEISGPGGGNVLITNWRDIAAAYAVRAADGALDQSLLEELFREMVTVSYTETWALFPHTETYPSADGTLREVEVRSPETVLRAEVSCKGAPPLSERRYGSRLDALLGYPLTLTADREALLAPYLPKDLPPLRRSVVRVACGLVGRVGYFWGGKSEVVGWDERWGVPAVVTAPGSASSGTARPLGLDCSGLVSWAAVTAAGDPSAYGAAGDGVRAQYDRCESIPWAEALPGDLAFFPDLSHVGIVVGAGGDGGLRVVHCSSSLGGVVWSEDALAVGFTEIGRPRFYPGAGN